MDRLSGFLLKHLTAMMVVGAIVIVLGAIVIILGAAPTGQLVGFLGVFLFGLGGWFRVIQLSEQETAAKYQRYAMTRGFEFAAFRPDAEKQYAALVRLFSKGHYHDWRNEISGRIDGTPFSAFEYVYTVGVRYDIKGGYSRDHTCAVMHWHVANRDFPQFSFGPQTLFDQARVVVGKADIVFFQDRSFSALYSLKGSDIAAVGALFPPSVRRFFVGHPGHYVAGAGHDLFWWRERSLPSPGADMDEFLGEGNSIRKLFVHDGDAVTESGGASDDDQDMETEHHIYIKR